jgi:hypothetical protein
VANWRGHLRIVAYLLLKGAVLEPKTGGNRSRPNTLSEKNFTLPEVTRTTLNVIYRNAEPPKKDLLQQIVDSDDNKKNIYSQTDALPLWAVIGLPKNDIPPQYMKSDYIWYYKAQNETKMQLLPLTQASHLLAVYLRERKTSGAITTRVPVPPVVGVFSQSHVWSDEEWSVDFNQMSATIITRTSTRRIQLALISRTKIWYYSSSPGNEGPFVPFSNSSCNQISSAFQANMTAFQFLYQIEKGLFSKPSTCVIHFEKKECTFNTNGITTIHKILNEEEYTRATFWEPDAYLPRIPPKYPPKEVTCVDVDPKTEEWKKILSYFYLTMPQKQDNKSINDIVKIQRLFYPDMRANFEQNLERAQEIHSGNRLFMSSIQYTRLLWHGTGSTDPMIIARNGWKINYSSDRNLWGKGSYFASDAAYSAGYSYQDRHTGNRRMFLAQVITGLGLQCLENANVRDVPTGYNSIVGYRHGSWIYVVYDNVHAFPAYLVEWKPK